MVVGVRQINDADLPSQGWVNTHLQYTHGYGMILSPVQHGQTNGSTGRPRLSPGRRPAGLHAAALPTDHPALRSTSG